MRRTSAVLAGLLVALGGCGDKKGGKDQRGGAGAAPTTGAEAAGGGAGNSASGGSGGAGNTGTGGSGGVAVSTQTGCVNKLDANIPQGDLVLRKSCGNVTVEGEITINATLTIEPGVTIELAEGASLWIGYQDRGSLVAEGTAEAPIVFTPASPTKVAGWWRGVILSGESKRSRLAHVTFEGTGSEGEQGAALRIEGMVDSIENVTFLKGKGAALIAAEGDETFGAPIEACRFETPVAARLNARHLPSLGANSYDDGVVVEILGGTVATSATIRAGAPHRLMGEILVERPTETAAMPTLTIEPGAVVVGITDSELAVGYGSTGSLRAIGSADKPIRFTSFDRTKGSWLGIGLYGNARDVVLEHAIVEYAKSEAERGAIRASRGAQARLANVSFEHLDGVGLSVEAGAAVEAQGLKVVDAKGAEWREGKDAP